VRRGGGAGGTIAGEQQERDSGRTQGLYHTSVEAVHADEQHGLDTLWSVQSKAQRRLSASSIASQIGPCHPQSIQQGGEVPEALRLVRQRGPRGVGIGHDPAEFSQ
jgi:hypothetical protein